MPQISVIIPFYNSEKYLRKCLDSLISQQFKDFEVLLVDDGSTDASMSICQDYVKRDNRFQLVYQKHQGQSTARNYAINVAQGDRIAFIDGEDYVNDDYLSTLNSQMDKYQSDIATQPYYRYNPQKREYGFLFHKNVNPDDYNGVYDATEWLLHLDLWKKIIGVGLDTFWGNCTRNRRFHISGCQLIIYTEKMF